MLSLFDPRAQLAIQLRDDGFPFQAFCLCLEAFLGFGQVKLQNRFHHRTAAAPGWEEKSSAPTKFALGRMQICCAQGPQGAPSVDPRPFVKRARLQVSVNAGGDPLRGFGRRLWYLGSFVERPSARAVSSCSKDFCKAQGLSAAFCVALGLT